MGFLTDWLTDWIKGLLIEGIMGNLTGLFDTVNTRVGEIAVQVGTTPAAWNAGVFSLIRQLSETVILPIAGLILTFVATYELIQLIIEKNNLHDLDYWIFFKWIFKTAAAILILSNTFNIVMAVFDMSQSVIANAAGLVRGSTDISASMLDNLEATLEAMEVGPLLGLWLQSFLIHITMLALNIIIFVIVYGRMIEIYLLTSLAPIPVATLSNREIGSMGQNYIKSLFAVGFQGLLILVCVAIYAVLVQGIATSGDPIGAIWSCIGYTVLLCFTLFKTGSVAKSIFGAHYAVKRGRGGAISFLVPGQQRATRLRSSTLGEGFDLGEIRDVIAGKRPLPKLDAPAPAAPRRVDLIVDIQERLRSGKGPAYERWAKVYNLKQMAAALQFIQENQISEYDQLTTETEAASARFHALTEQLRQTEADLAYTSELMGAVVQYAKTRPVFNEYKATKYSKRFLAQHEAELADYRAAKATLNDLLDGAKLPKMAQLKEKRRKLAAEKKALYAKYRAAQQEMRQTVAVKTNIDYLLGATDGRKNKEQER